MNYKIGLSELFLITSAIVLALWQLLIDGYPITHSTIFNLNWVFQFSQQFLAGQIYPRWLEHSFLNMGSPTYVFYPPMCMFATLPFAALGWSVSASTVGSMILAVLVCAGGAFAYSTSVFREVKGTFFLPAVVTALTVLSPYFLENIYVRGALGETWAMAWLPWILWSSSVNLRTGKVWFLQSLFYCLFALSHPPTLLNVTLLFGLTIFLIYTQRSLTFIQYIFRLYVPLGLGLGLASLYLFSALFDQKLVNIEHIGIYNPLDRFMLTGLTEFKPQWTTNYEAALIPFMQMSLFIGLLAAVLFWKYRNVLPDSLRFHSKWWFVFLAISLLMMTDLTAVFYRSVPILQKIQFSWRWMAVTGIVIPLLWGLVLASISTIANKWVKLGIWSITLIWIGIPFLTNLQNVKFQKDAIALTDQLFASQPPFPAEMDMALLENKKVPLFLEKTAGGQIFLSDAHEYLPKESSLSEIAARPTRYDLVEWAKGLGVIQEIQWHYGKRHFVVESPNGGELYLRMFSWPGWQVLLNGQEPSSRQRASDGRLAIQIAAGQSQVEVTYVGTPNENLGKILSKMILIGMIGGLLLTWRRRLQRS